MPALRRIVHEVRSLELGAAPRYEQHHLVVGPAAVEAPFDEPALTTVRVTIADPEHA